MGIKNLKKFIREKYPNEIQNVNLSNFYGQIFMMDIMSYIYKFKVSMKEKWLQSIITLLKLFKLNNVHVNIVFEGESPVEKSKEKEQRRKQRQQQENKIKDIKKDLDNYNETGVVSLVLKELCEKINQTDNDKINRLLHFNLNNNFDTNITKDKGIEILSEKMIEQIEDYIYKKENQLVNITEQDINKIKDICDVFGVPYYQSENEAETLCCKMSKNVNYDKKPIGVISEDSDVLAYGSNILLCDLNISNGDCNVIYLPSLLKSLDMNYNQFIEFCVMCGTDYNTNIPGIGIIKCYELIKKYNSIENIFNYEEKLIDKKIKDAIQKKLKKNNSLNQMSNEGYSPQNIYDENFNREERSFSNENESIDIDMTLEKLKTNMLHSVEMFNLVKFSKNVYSTKYHWDSNIDFEKVFEYCLRYNIDFNSVEKLWKNKIKFI